MTVSDEDTREHAKVLREAFETYVERSNTYGQVWRQYGALSNLLSAARKIDRLMEAWWFMNDNERPAMHKDALDDAQDAINYLTFFIRNARNGNMTGERAERPELPVVPVLHPVFADDDPSPCHDCLVKRRPWTPECEANK